MRETPKDVVAAFERLGGANRFGEPNFRAIWSEDRLAHVGGTWHDYDNNGNLIRTIDEVRKVPKYFAIRERWIVEKWYPPEYFGSPETWFRTTKKWNEEGNLAQLGGYPERGDYQHCCTIEDADGNFVQLTAGLAEEIVYLVKAKQEHKRTLAEEKYAQEVAARKQSEENQIILKDATPPFSDAGITSRFVTVAGGPTHYNGHKAAILGGSE